MSSKRYIRRPVEDSAIGRINKKRSVVIGARHRDKVTPNQENSKRVQAKAKMTDTSEQEKENKPLMEKIANPYNNEICQLCNHSGREKGEWYCHQDNPVVRCYQILNCSVYLLRDEGVLISFSA